MAQLVDTSGLLYSNFSYAPFVEFYPGLARSFTPFALAFSQRLEIIVIPAVRDYPYPIMSRHGPVVEKKSADARQSVCGWRVHDEVGENYDGDRGRTSTFSAWLRERTRKRKERERLGHGRIEGGNMLFGFYVALFPLRPMGLTT